MPEKHSGRSSMQGYVWATRVGQVGTVGVVPPLAGYWLDAQFGTAPWLLVVGGLLGFGLLMLEVVSLSDAVRRNKDGKPGRR